MFHIKMISPKMNIDLGDKIFTCHVVISEDFLNCLIDEKIMPSLKSLYLKMNDDLDEDDEIVIKWLELVRKDLFESMKSNIEIHKEN